MSEIVKDSTIKLFGKTISLSPDIKVVSGIRVLDQQQSSSETSISSQGSKEHEYNSINSSKETSADGSTSSGITDDLKAPNIEKRSLSPKTPTKEEQSERSVSPEKTLKKPDKLLPCPRCNSVDTKFCYYNNYNVQQPRYFCKNCQRYWTAGGVMRNVPVGSGRRKSKNAFAPNYHHGVNVSSLVPNGFVVFGSDAFLDESMTTSSHLDDKSRICTPNGLSPSGTRFAFYPPTPYWAGGPVQCPWAGPQVHQTPPTLGKHSRDGVMIRSSNSEKENCLDSVLIPKTIRIHDPSDAAKSSIWSTLGIKNERIGSNDGRSLFKEFVAKGDRSSNVDNASLALQANPAAFSRSLRFQVSA